jgi:hypothetical protein
MSRRFTALTPPAPSGGGAASAAPVPGDDAMRVLAPLLSAGAEEEDARTGA